jgi:hypothetical protein
LAFVLTHSASAFAILTAARESSTDACDAIFGETGEGG